MNSSGQTPVNSAAAQYEAEALRLAAALDPAAVSTHEYRFGSEPCDILDVLAPAGDAEGPRPVMVFFHGGGFTHGTRSWNSFMAPALHRAGMILVTPEYPLLAPGSPGPVQMDAVTRALGWVRENAATFGGDPARIFIGGHSAGAALAAAFSLRPDLLAQAGLGEGGLRGVLCMSGSLNRWAITGTDGASYDLPPGPLPVAPDAPLALLDNAAVPTFVTWGTNERQLARVERSSRTLIDAYTAKGVPVRTLVQEGEDHFTAHLAIADVDGALAAAVAEWVDRLR